MSLQTTKLYSNIRYWQGQNITTFILSGCLHIPNIEFIDPSSVHFCHAHRQFHEFIYVLSGEMTVVSKERRINLQKDDILSIPPGFSHQIYHSGPDIQAVLLDVNFSQHTKETIQRTPHLVDLVECIEDELHLINNIAGMGLAKVRDDGSCRHAIDDFVETVTRHYTGDFIRSTGELVDLYITTLQNFIDPKVKKDFENVGAAVSNRLANYAIRVTQYIRDNCTQNLTISDVASALSYSNRQVQRIIQEYYGENISYLVKFYRVELISKLLKETKMSLDELAGHTGFGNVKTMRRAFAEITGMTITQYRAQLAEYAKVEDNQRARDDMPPGNLSVEEQI